MPAGQHDSERRDIELPLDITNDALADAVVRVVGPVACTGTLIADDLVLTAHHCVSKRDDTGRVIFEDVEPTDVHVELGGNDFPYGEVAVRMVLAPECGYVQGEGDIAILVLSRRLVGMPIWTPRVDAPPKIGDGLDPMGFGRCAADSSTIHREIRTGGPVLSVTTNQVVADVSICPGDSGGPAFDSHDNTRREVFGVVSASVMDNSSKTTGRSYFTRLDKWAALFSAAHEISRNGASVSDLPPFRSCSTRPGAD
ncbi:MAG: S1 family peptidase [Polyangiaceae bacterium]